MAMELMVGFASEAYRHSSEVKKIHSPPGTQTLPSKISIVKKRKHDFPLPPTNQHDVGPPTHKCGGPIPQPPIRSSPSKLSIVKKRKQDFPLPSPPPPTNHHHSSVVPPTQTLPSTYHEYPEGSGEELKLRDEEYPPSFSDNEGKQQVDGEEKKVYQ